MVDHSKIEINGISIFRFDRSRLTDELTQEGKNVAKIARRLVSRTAISNAGELPGKVTGRLQRTIKSKVFSSGMGVVITHKLRSNEDRYPFMLAYGTPTIEARQDHIATAFSKRRFAALSVLKVTLKKAINVDKII
ncbi:hypothetical protein N9Y67_00050 [Pseudomonadota bacterium]|nr:hypothetical protein [Pseudomonadota bacterium]